MMNKANGWWLTGLVVTVIALSAPMQAAVEYTEGFTWRRLSDWTTGPEENDGTTVGNPGDDSLGNGVWNYEYVDGAESPWYEAAADDMVWDFAAGRWQMDGAAKPNINFVGMTQSTQGDACPYIPVVRWENPTGKEILLSITGGMRVEWHGAADMPVDVAVARIDGDTVPLYTNSVEKPADADNAVWGFAPILTQVGAGDSIAFSARATDCIPAVSWVTFKDYGVTLKIADMLPEPGSLTMLALGAVALLRRKK